jgi:hypothetical protein
MNVRSRFHGPLAGALTALALIAALPEPSAHAQGAPPPGDSVTIIARQRYNEGVAAYDAGKFEDARASFLQAYALKHHPAVLLNLGQSELRSNHPDDAGNHLQQFIREFAAASPDQRAAAEKGLAEAKRHVGFVVIIVDAPGADLSIDGTTVGKSPLVDPVYLKPGKHTVFAALQGKNAVASVDVKAGTAASASLSLGIAPAPAPPPVEPTPVPVPVPVAPPPVAPEPPPPSTFPPPGVTPLPNPEPLPPVPPPEAVGPKRTFGDWYTHKPGAWVGTGLAGLGLLGGIIFGTQALKWSSQSQTDATATEKQIPIYNSGKTGNNLAPSNVCNPSVLGSSKALNGYFGMACGVVSSDISSYHTDVGLVAASWVVFGLSAVGTIVYALVDYPRYANAPASGPSGPSGRQEGTSLAVVPLVSPTVQGVGVLGSF